MGYIMTHIAKRIKHRLARTKKLAQATREHKAWLKSQGLDTIKIPKGYGQEMPDYSTKKKMPPTSDRITGETKRKPAQHYSGERKLLGIGMMHKSNLVPVWDEESAIEISKMRRN